MIKRIRGSLTFKIFLITSMILICVCGLTYGFIAYFMPQTYTYGISEDIDNKMDHLVADLEETKYEDSGPLFDDFIVNNTVDLQLLDADGNVVERPGNVQTGFVETAGNQATMAITLMDQKSINMEDTEEVSAEQSKAAATSAAAAGERNAEITGEANADKAGETNTEIAGEANANNADESNANKASEADANIAGETKANITVETNANEAQKTKNVETDSISMAENTVSMQSASFNYNHELSNVSVISSSVNMEYGTQKAVTFAGSDQTYDLYVLGAYKFVNQAEEAMYKILPWLIVVIVFISTLTAYLYSRYVTRPVVRLSRISKKMSDLEFNWVCDEKRNDEIGILSSSLNELSQKLSAALLELKSANESLQKDIETERKLEQKRLEFFSAVSHELKTPITVMKGQLEGMMYQVGIYKNRDKYLARSYSVASTMEEMVQEILTVSRMESSGFTPQMEEFDLGGMVKECARKQDDLFVQKDMEVSYNLSQPLSAYGDKKLLQKAVNNIISNAIHYSPDGAKISIEAYEEEGGVTLCVENSGVHLDVEAIPRIFEAFFRVEKSRNRNTGGSGLGLYIVKMILELHHADYKIENTASGVAFTFSI